MGSKKNVAANVVRAWAKDNLTKIDEAGHKCLGEGARGRLHPEVVTAFNRSNPKERYVVGTPNEAQTVVVSLSPDKSIGLKTPRKVTMTVAEVRTLSGHEGKGRIPNAVKRQAALTKIGF